MFKKNLLLSLTLLFACVGAVFAAQLVETPASIQTGDSDLVISHKAALAAAGNSYTNITTATTTVIKAGPGILDRIQINTGASSATIAIYDNASAGSGTKIGTAAATAQGTLWYNVATTNGITIVTSAAADITVSYR